MTLLPPEKAGHRDRLPELRDLSAHDGVRQHRLRPEDAEGGEAGDSRPRRQGAGTGQSRRLRAALPARAFRRRAAAGGARPRAHHRAQDPASRRAPERARQEAPGGDEVLDQGAAALAAHHHRLRHPRPGRGAHDVRPDRGDEPGARGADRRPRYDLRASGRPLRHRLHRRVQHPRSARRGGGRQRVPRRRGPGRVLRASARRDRDGSGPWASWSGPSAF